MLLPPWLQTGNHVFELDGEKSGEAEKDKIWALQRLTKDWNSYDLTIYTDGSSKNDAVIGGGGILLTAGHPCSPTIYRSYAIPFRAIPPGILANDPKKVLRILEKWTSVPDLPDVSRPGITTT